jgi:hypothetical protein
VSLDSSLNSEISQNIAAPVFDKLLQDPVDAMKQLLSRADQPSSKSAPSDLSSSAMASAKEPGFLDMGDTGGLYKSSAVKADTTDAPASVAKPAATDAAPAAAQPTAEKSAATPAKNETATAHGADGGGAHHAAGAHDDGNQSKGDHTENTSTSLAGDGSGKTVAESQHVTKHGETLDGIARKTLGPQASEKEVERYARVVASENGITDPKKMQAGTKLDMPAHQKDGTITFTSSDNRDEHWTVHKDGSVEMHNKADGTALTRKPLDQSGSYQEHHTGPKPEDNYETRYTNKDHTYMTSRTSADGTTVTTGSDGYRKTTDKAGNYEATYGPGSSAVKSSYDADSKVTTTQNVDGSTTKYFGKEDDKHSQTTDADGTKTTKWADGTVKVQKTDDQGRETGHQTQSDGAGGYKEHAWGPNAKDNYDESYDAKTGTTTRVEAKGTDAEKTTTKWANGTEKVESKDGNNYQKNADGSEHHWGKENYDKPAYDYKNDQHLNKAKEALEAEVKKHIPADQQAGFKKDMDDFEARAKKDHLSPEEVAKTYDQMSRMLKPEDKDAVVNGADRALLAEGLMHQTAHPDQTNQGWHNTCNVTTVAEQTLAKNPSKVAEMAATTALTGQWTAPDGKVIKIDKGSLKPGAEEDHYPSTKVNERSYATQVLNVVMANDATQRRVPPETYVQRTPDGAIPNDTGERRLDASGKVIKAQAFDSNSGMWKVNPDNSPGLTDHEIAQVGKQLNGSDYHLLTVGDQVLEGEVDNVASAKALTEKLHQLKQQGQLPVTVSVDGNHGPITGKQESAGAAAHVVTIDDYDEKAHNVHVSNQWGQQSDKWVKLEDLYNNASGDTARGRDGVDAEY